MTLLAIEWSLLLRTRERRWSNDVTECEWLGQPPKTAPSRWGSCTPSNTWFLGPTRMFIKNGMSIGSAVFAQFTVVSHYFTMRRYVSPKLPLPLGESGPPSNTWHLRPTRVIIPNGISIGSAVLYGSQILCCTMHCQWGRKPPNCALFLGISSPCRRRTEPWPWVACTEKLVKIASVIPNIGYIRFTPWFYSVLTCLRANCKELSYELYFLLLYA